MNGDEKYFRDKFAQASKHLGAPAKQIVSLKYRAVSDYDYYVQLLKRLHAVKALAVSDLGHTLSGHGYLLSYGDQKVIFVEHETGLELLYIAGSVASIIGFVVQLASTIRNRRRDPFPIAFDVVEIRYFDESGAFLQEHSHQPLPPEAFMLPPSPDAKVKELEDRIAKLERTLATKKPGKSIVRRKKK